MKLLPKGYHISHFKTGDLIKRVIPIKNKKIKGGYDDSYINTSIMFHYIVNNKIYYGWWHKNRKEFIDGFLDLKEWGNNWIKVNKL